MTLIKLHYWLIQYIMVKQGIGEVINSPCHAQVWLQENFALAHILVCTCSFGFHRVVVETPVLVNKHKIHIYTHTHTQKKSRKTSLACDTTGTFLIIDCELACIAWWLILKNTGCDAHLFLPILALVLYWFKIFCWS